MVRGLREVESCAIIITAYVAYLYFAKGAVSADASVSSWLFRTSIMAVASH